MKCPKIGLERATAFLSRTAYPSLMTAMTLSRIALVSDIHGNLPALEAVWAEIERESVDLIVNLGDIASGPLWPRETVQWLIAHEAQQPARWCTIAGNHERQALAADIDRMGPSDAYAARALGAVERAWLGALPAACWIANDVLLCHGTPANDLTYFMETVTAGLDAAGPGGVRMATAGELAQRAAELAPVASPRGLAAACSGEAASLILCGHTHVARSMAVAGGPLVVNPGSVGLQAYEDQHPYSHVIEGGSPHARWGLVERRPNGGGWHVQLRATAYDWLSAAAQAETNGRGDWADALRSGFMGRR